MTTTWSKPTLKGGYAVSKSKGTRYTFIFATFVCVVCSLVLAVSATVLQPLQRANIKLDVVQNILISVGHEKEELTTMTPDQVFELFAKEFETILIDKDNVRQTRDFMETELKKLKYEDNDLKTMTEGELVATFKAKLGLLANKAGKSKADYDPGYKLVYAYNPDQTTTQAYVIPIEGYGLWDLIHGYLALNPDLNTVRGITFYQHKETPGLGALITEDWFVKQYKGKKILDPSGKLVSVEVSRGKAKDHHSGAELDHYVDGISGATLTGKGLNQFIKANLEIYEPYFVELRTKQSQGTEL
ncbi:MAG: NADH:ubiquinone reductase (Na(+)-transporting) subunit C [Acidobacteria bacterium]|nr:MAG: NADH:ubiquinone reductase (Na(+)-transporting) subunit C [Acidobacteriota bacterium]